MTTTIRAELERSKKCCDTMGEALGGKTSPPGERSPILMGYWSLTYHHHNGIICLLHNELPAPAFALLRPIVEAALRAHVAIMGTDQDIEKLRKDTYKTNLNTIGPEIDTRFKMADALTSFLTKANQIGLHSYTHGGVLQLARQFSGNDLKPNYAEPEIIELIRIATSAVYLATKVLAQQISTDDEAACMKTYIGWGQSHPQPQP